MHEKIQSPILIKLYSLIDLEQSCTLEASPNDKAIDLLEAALNGMLANDWPEKRATLYVAIKSYHSYMRSEGMSHYLIDDLIRLSNFGRVMGKKKTNLIGKEDGWLGGGEPYSEGSVFGLHVVEVV